MRVVLAPDKFKGSLRADDAARAMARGLRRARPDACAVEIPLADGGEGTVDAFLARPGWRAVRVAAHDPFGRSVDACFAFDGATAVCELASASGFDRRRDDDPPGALVGSTYGTGEVVRAALDAGATRIVLGVGGSATNDGGAGLLAALGARFCDAAGVPPPPGGAGLAALVRVDLRALDPRFRSVAFDLATDVDNPLLGPRGASAVFGPQKGARAADVALLDRALGRFADALVAAGGREVRELPGCGAGGGVPLVALALGRARVASGFGVVAELTGLADEVRRADACFTGEGSIDAQTLGGKVVDGVARLAAARGIPCVAFGGRVDPATRRALAARGCDARAITPAGMPLEQAMREAASLLEAAAAVAAQTLVLG